MQLLPNEVSVEIEGRNVKIRAWVHDLIGQGGYPLPICSTAETSATA